MTADVKWKTGAYTAISNYPDFLAPRDKGRKITVCA